MLLSVLLSIVICFSKVESMKRREPPTTPGLRSLNELVADNGYSITNYEVITEDGYSLWLHRIGNNSGPPVLLQYGLMSAPEQWVLRGNKRDLAFMLLKENFDVWFSNQRGSIYNEYNVKYLKVDPRFWNFSFHESGYYDLPANIDFILSTRGQKNLFYIGHSLGTTVYLVMASTRPEYNEKIHTAVMLSPIAYPPNWDQLRPLLQASIKNTGFITQLIRSVTRQPEVTHRDVLTTSIVRELCAKATFIQKICLNIVGVAGGEHRRNLDMELWGNILPYYFAGSSLKTFLHLTQVYASGEFKQYDYGLNLNLKKYGNPRPPPYPMDQARAPIAIYWGQNDPLLSETSVGNLASDLPNVLFSKPVPDPLFNHIDMIVGKNAHIVLYPDVVKLFKSLL